MKCSTLNLAGLCKDCASSKGGIRQVIAAYYGDLSFTTNSDGVITGATIASGASVYLYQFRKGTGSMTSTLNVDVANGVNYVSTELVLQFTKMETKKRIEMAVLSVEELVLLVEDANGTWFVLGKDEPVIATTGTGQTGQAVGDGNFYSITFTDEATTWPPIITSAAVEALNAACPQAS